METTQEGAAMDDNKAHESKWEGGKKVGRGTSYYWMRAIEQLRPKEHS